MTITPGTFQWKVLQRMRIFHPHLTVSMDVALKIILAAALLGELGAVFANVLSHLFFRSELVWTYEVAELALSTIAFVGGALAYRRGEHAFIRTLIEALPLGYQRACYTLVGCLVFTIAVIAGLNSLPLFVAQWQHLTPVLEMRVSWFVLPLVASMVVVAVTAIERLLVQPRSTLVAIGVPFSALVFSLAVTRNAWRPWFAGDSAIALAIGLVLFTVVVGLPIGFALLLGAVSYVYASGTAPMVALPPSMVSGVSNFVLLALPFFVLAASVMTRGGISVRLVRLVHALVGHFRGGLLQVMVVSMYLFSGLSGSKAADVAAVGTVMRDMLRRENYSLEQAAAVLASCAVMGETVPPSITMLVLGSVTTLSIGALFIAGIIPAAVVGVCLMLLIYLLSRRSQAARVPRASLQQLATAGLGGVMPLLMPVILFGGILLGVATPTEVSSFAVVYGLILACIIYRELSFREFVLGIIDCAAVSGMILFILATSSSFAWALTIAHLPERLVGILTSSHQSQWLFMLTSIVLLVVTGSILEGLPALLILAPILMPMATQVGVNQLHYGIVLMIAMGLGAFAPPVGAGFYVTCAICETTLEKSARAMIPFVIVLFLGLLLVALVPWFTLLLPTIFHFK